jgi:hypothetical protein
MLANAMTSKTGQKDRKNVHDISDERFLHQIGCTVFYRNLDNPGYTCELAQTNCLEQEC